jgi:primosomal protein N' (replication factor Y)
MYIVSVVPLSNTLPKEEFSYYTKTSLELNTLVRIKLRKKNTYGLVRKCSDVKEAKSVLRTSSIGMKKIQGVVREKFFTEEFLEAAKAVANDHALLLGSVLDAFVPKTLIDTSESLPEIPEAEKTQKDTPKPEVLQAPQKGRFKYYEEIIRDCLGEKRSIFLVVPDRQTGEKAYAYYQKKYGDRMHLFHSQISEKKLGGKIKEALEGEPVLLIGTAPYLSIPRKDMGMVILERENSDTYRHARQPFLDARIFVREFAELNRAKFILGADLVRTETFHELENGHYGRSPHYEKQITDGPEATVGNMTKYRKDQEGFQIFHETVMSDLKKRIEEGQKIFLFALQKGLASVTLCRDCGTTIFCPKCSVPLHLFETFEKGREFQCTKCGFREDARDKLFCDHCGGFQLEAFGLGIDTIRKELERLFPEVPISQIDGITTRTHPKAVKEIEKFNRVEDGHPSILLGTEKALKYLPDEVDMTVVTTLDSLFTIPNFRISSKIFAILTEIANHTKESLYIQTRNPKADLLQTFRSGELERFLKNDLAERERFDFPPLVKFIKVTTAVKPGQEEKQEEKLEHFFAKYDPLVYRGFVERVKKRYVINTLIRLKSDEDMTGDLKERLRSLPPDYEVRIDPESIL